MLRSLQVVSNVVRSRAFGAPPQPSFNRATFSAFANRGGPASTSDADIPLSTVSENPSVAAKKKKSKKRLDELCMERFPTYSRNVIQSFIAQGKVLVDGKPVTKAGSPVSDAANVLLNAEEPKYVCRGGLKLEKALDHFGVDPSNRVCLDSGLSTGGFTDCLLQRGATRVYGVDVGYGQVAEKIRVDPRVVVMERTNLRHLRKSDLPEPITLATLDLSFISVLRVIPAVTELMAEGQGEILVLIKPQFEAGRDKIRSGGVVKDPAVHAEVIERVTRGVCALGYRCLGVTESPIKGEKSGNTEFLAHFVRDVSQRVEEEARVLTLRAMGEDPSEEGGAAAEESGEGGQLVGKGAGVGGRRRA